MKIKWSSNSFVLQTRTHGMCRKKFVDWTEHISTNALFRSEIKPEAKKKYNDPLKKTMNIF